MLQAEQSKPSAMEAQFAPPAPPGMGAPPAPPGKGVKRSTGDKEDSSKASKASKSLSNKRQKKPAPVAPFAVAPAAVAPRYGFVKKLASGGYGQVYLALDTVTGEKVAIKTLNNYLSKDDKIRTAVQVKFQRAVAIYTQLGNEHPYIAGLIGFDKGKGWLVFPYKEGSQDIMEYLETGHTVQQDRSIVLQLLDALSYIHGKGILHRDLKPENIIIVPADLERGIAASVMICDFDDACLKTDSVAERSKMVGTLEHMPLAILYGKCASEKTDIYSFVSTIFTTIKKRYDRVLEEARTILDTKTALFNQQRQPLSPLKMSQVYRCGTQSDISEGLTRITAGVLRGEGFESVQALRETLGWDESGFTPSRHGKGVSAVKSEALKPSQCRRKISQEFGGGGGQGYIASPGKGD